MSATSDVLLISDNTTASGCRYLMSALLDNSFTASMVIYKSDHEDNISALLELIDKLEVSIVGMSVFSSSRMNFQNVAGAIKKHRPDIFIVCGGPDVNSNFEYCIEWSDFVCLSDGENAFPKLCKTLLSHGDVTVEDLPNIYFKQDNKLYKNRLIAETDLDNYSFPYFSDDNIYIISASHIKQYKDSENTVYNVYASRGCPYRCSYCANHIFAKNHPNKRYYRIRSVDSIIEEMLTIINKNPITHIVFHDEQFGISEKWINEFTIKYKKSIDLPFHIQMNPKTYNMDKIIKLKKCGLAGTSFGLQSASPKIREIYRRPETLTEVLNANSMLRKVHIPHFFDIIVDNPYEDEKDLEKTLYFLLKLKKPFVAKTFDLIHLPNTELTDLLLANNIISDKQIEGNYLYKQNISWRVDEKNVSMPLDEKYIVALMHLTGNVLVPNWAIKLLHKSSKRLPSIFKKQLILFLFSPAYYSLAMKFNTIPGLIHDKGFYFIVKKMVSRLHGKHTRSNCML